MIGNSSSGILEAPLIGTPTINVGSRQLGRERAPSVFDSDGSLASMEKCFKQVLKFNKKKPRPILSPYYKKNPISNTIKIIKKLKIPSNNLKKFHTFNN